MRRNRNATPQFIGALTELVWTQIGKNFVFFSSLCSIFALGCDLFLFFFSIIYFDFFFF